ncbi:MAG TPA: tetratricopeptide repeat protein [Opitutaceae bacterium]|nr:tetratricopeptide repeat protein [Opitutaceae bacterium]
MSLVRVIQPKRVTVDVLYCCILVLLTAAVYANSIHGELLFDDLLAIWRNPSLHPTDGLWHVFFAPPDNPVGGRPLVNFSYFLNYAANGTAVEGYHLVNILIHCATALSLFCLIRQALRSESIPEPLQERSGAISFWAALVWVLNPIQTICVSYISQRSELMMGFCYVQTLFWFGRYLESSNQTTDERSANLSRTIAICFCAAGMMCKEVMATAPLLCLLYDRSFYSDSFVSILRRRWSSYIMLASTWIILAGLLFSTHGRGVGLEMGVTWHKYLLTESRVVLRYLGLCIWPNPLIFDYGTAAYNPTRTEWPYLIFTGFLVLGCCWFYLRRPSLAFVAMAFFVALATTSSVIPVALQPMAENRLYLPSMAVWAGLATCIFRISDRAAPLIFTACAVFFGILTFKRNSDFQSGISIWSDTVRKIPNSARAYNNLGIALLEKNRLDEADAAFKKALTLRPHWADVVSNRGNIALAKRDFDVAEAFFRQAVQDNPASVVQKNNLAGLLLQRGKEEEAKALYEESLRRTPDDPNALCGLGDVALAEKKVSSAIEFYKRSISAMPHLAVAHNNLGNALVELGDNEEAEAEFGQAVKLNPSFQKARSNYATMLARRGQYERAIKEYTIALRIYPADTESRVNMGFAYQLLGNIAAARSCFEEALRHDSQDARAKQYLENLQSNSVPALKP